MPRVPEQRGVGIRFGRRDARPEVRGRLIGMSVLLLVVAGALGLRATRAPAVAAGVSEVVVEVRGDVPAPGFHVLPPPVGLHDALAAAGLGRPEVVDVILEAGTRVVVDASGVRLETMEELLVVGLPIDVNRAGAVALQAVPGIGPARAAAIVADRAALGPFEDVDALERVRGIGPATVEHLRPFLTVASVPAPP